MGKGKSKVNWTEAEKQAFKPPEKLTVSQWADKHRILDEISSHPGQWKTDFTPFLRAVMDSFNDPFVEEITFVSGTQIGKTEAFFNILGYIIDQAPGPTQVVYPSDKVAEFTSENRIQRMVKLCPTLNEKFDDKSKRLELQFIGMYLVLSGANSPAELASRPIKYLFFDETDKYKDFIGRDVADPIALGIERTKSYSKAGRKIFKTSSPTNELGPIWKSLMACDVIFQFYVPCPHCRNYQTFKLGQIKWPEELNDLPYDERSKAVRFVAWYECESCGQVIEERHKAEMLHAGEWRPVRYTKDGKWESAEWPNRKIRQIGFQINSIYSPNIEFGQVAEEFLKSKPFPEKLRNFINGWLGEPWRDKSVVMESDIVLTKQADHPRGRVPHQAVLLTAGVDVQLDHMWWIIRGWGPRLTSWLVDYGRAETWTEVEQILTRVYPSIYGEARYLNLAFLDSGYRTDEVYEFCAQHPEFCRPTKGSSKALTAPFNISTIEKTGFEGLKLWILNTPYFKDFIHGRLRKKVEEDGSWNVCDGCERYYADHITAEQKITGKDPKTGRSIEEWRLITAHAQNHFLDCEVNAAAAAEQAGVRYILNEVEDPGPIPESQEEKDEESEQVKEEPNEGFIPRRNWFGR